MQYFVLPFILLIYFEFLGRTIFYKFKIDNFEFSFVIGFLFTMAITYVTFWPVSIFKGSFYTLAFIFFIYLLTSLIFIFKNIKNISIKFNIKAWCLFLILLGVLMFISYNRTLGEEHGFDQIYYLNTISYNIGNTELNSIHPLFGSYPNTDNKWDTYAFQSYYYLIGIIIWLCRSGLSIIGKSFETMPGVVWSFEILQEMFLIATSLTCIKELKSKNRILNIGFLVLLVLFIGNFYYNNVYGFIGNNYRMSIHSIATIFLFRYLKDYDNKYIILFLVSMLGMCGVSSTGTFALVFALFGLFFSLIDYNNKLFRYYLLACIIPAINIVMCEISISVWSILAVVTLFGVLWFFNDTIIKIFKPIKVRVIFVILCFIAMALLSYTVTHNFLSFDVFINNYSEIQDMSWDYFYFIDLRHWIFNLMILIPLAYYLFKERKNSFSIMSIVLIVVIYNPFVCSYMNKINWVYYRTYDIIINQFTIIYFINYMIETISLKYFGKTMTIVTLIGSIALACIQIPRYYHKTFKPDEDYNYLFKLENSELYLIEQTRKLIEEYNIENPKIINQTFYMPCYIKGGGYLFGKEKRYNYDNYDEISFNLWLIFFPHDEAYDNFYPEGVTPDYANMNYYLEKCDYDILIVKSSVHIDDEDGNYVQLSSKVEEAGYIKSEYSTSEYDIYYLKQQR